VSLGAQGRKSNNWILGNSTRKVTFNVPSRCLTRISHGGVLLPPA
jgi:hypothetical protein